LPLWLLLRPAPAPAPAPLALFAPNDSERDLPLLLLRALLRELRRLGRTPPSLVGVITTSAPAPAPAAAPLLPPSSCTWSRQLDDGAKTGSADAARPRATDGRSFCVCVASSLVSQPSAPRIATGRWSKPWVGACAVCSSGCCIASASLSGGAEADRIKNCGGDSIVSTKMGGASACFGVDASSSVSLVAASSSDEIIGGGVPRELNADRGRPPPYAFTSLMGDDATAAAAAATAAVVTTDADPCCCCFDGCCCCCCCALVLFHNAPLLLLLSPRPIAFLTAAVAAVAAGAAT